MSYRAWEGKMSAYATYEAAVIDDMGQLSTFQFRTVGTPCDADVRKLAAAEFGPAITVKEFGRMILRNKRIGKTVEPRIERVSARVRVCA